MSTELAEKLSALVKYQLPDFVRDNYETFQDFIIAYYEFLEQDTEAQYKIQKARSYSDIDETLDDFVDYFLKQYAYNLPESVFKNQQFQDISLTSNDIESKRAFAKYLIKFHSYKGSEGAIKLLFRILFDDEITFYYPKEDIFKPSTSEWYVRKILKVINTTNVTNYSDTIDGSVVGVTSKASAVVKGVSDTNANARISTDKHVYEIELDKGSLSGTFLPNENVFFQVGNLTTGNIDILSFGKILPVINSLTINQKGAGHQLNDSITIYSGPTRLFEASISKITPLGGIKEVSILDSGNFEDFTSTSYSLGITDPSGTKTGKYESKDPLISIVVFDESANSLIHGYDTTDKVNIQFTTGNVFGNVAYDFSNVVSNVFLINSAKVFTVDRPTGYIDAPKGSGNIILNPLKANLSVNFGAVTSYSGLYNTKESHPNDTKKIQDSNYYQEYSYVIRATQSSSLWSNIIKKTLHPAGYKLFSEVYLSVANSISAVSVVPDNALYTTILTFLKLLVTDPPVIATSVGTNVVELSTVSRAARNTRFRIGPTYNTLERFKYDYTNLRIYDVGDLSLEFLSQNIQQPILIAPPDAILRGNSNIILNSTFDSSSNWSLESGFSITNGNLVITTATGNTSQSFNTAGNVKVMATFEVKSRSAGSVRLMANTRVGSNIFEGTARTAVGNYSEIFFVNAPIGNVIINAAGFTGNVDNVYVKVLESITN